MSVSMNEVIDVQYETITGLEDKTNGELGEEVNLLYHEAVTVGNIALTMMAQAGQRLLIVKERLPHGQFEEWCKENLEFSKRKAENMMKFARKCADENSLFSKTQTFADIGISRVWALLSAPEDIAAEVIGANDVADMTVRQLKDEIARLKEEKEAAEHKAKILDHNNDDIRKELASMRRKLTESISETDFLEMQAAAQAQKEDLTRQLNTAKAAGEEVQIKLDKAKEDLKKQKEKLKKLETSMDEDLQKRLAEVGAEIEERARSEAQKDAENALNEQAESIQSLEAQVLALEAEKAKLSNTALMEFKVYVDQLQDIYYKIDELITGENEDVGMKMRTALQTVIGRWME